MLIKDQIYKKECCHQCSSKIINWFQNVELISIEFFCELTLSILKCISYSSKKYWLNMPIMHSYKKEIRWMTKWFCNALFRGNSTYQERKNHDVKPVIHCILWVHNQVKQYRIVHQRKYIFLCQKKLFIRYGKLFH